VTDAAFVSYLERVEQEFFRLKGRPGTLSPTDFARTREWFESGVPLDAVLEGVASAFGAQSAGRSGDSEEVNSLAFCEPFIERAIARRRSL
jgi:hypothetical protein